MVGGRRLISVIVDEHILGRVVRTDERRKEGMGRLFSWCVCVFVF